ncbi:hypothetical protein AERO9AM_10355 [Aeromicrobium sp. 9AM]|nr:hypothetical protein AERO9AM_10355 [Aeromicrobium sp. 9AM]
MESVSDLGVRTSVPYQGQHVTFTAS